MGKGSGKTNTAFQMIWGVWKAERKKAILFLADRKVVVDQTRVNDFGPFGTSMAKFSCGSKTIERADGAEVELTTGARQKAPHRHRLRGLPPRTHGNPQGKPRTSRAFIILGRRLAATRCGKASRTASWLRTS
jgi:Type III restriction enzyme, res subunit